MKTKQIFNILLILLAVVIILLQTSDISHSYSIKILLGKTLTSEDYQKLCFNNEYETLKSDKIRRLCKLIQPDYMHAYFYGECIAVSEENISLCNLLLQDQDPDYALEHRQYCEKNFNIYFLLKTRQVKFCDSLKEKPDIKIFHSHEDDFLLCNEIHKHLVEDAAIGQWESLCSRLFDKEKFMPRCIATLLNNSSICDKIDGIDEKIKCKIYTREIECDRLNDKEYILNLIDNTNHFTYG